VLALKGVDSNFPFFCTVCVTDIPVAQSIAMSTVNVNVVLDAAEQIDCQSSFVPHSFLVVLVPVLPTNSMSFMISLQRV
jgi:hypothetical protein